MADSTAGGRQVDGFHGLSIEYMRSPKFLQVDDGWNRIVWMPSNVKERVKDFVPAEVADKIATEKETETIEQLKKFLEEKAHPIIERWKEIPKEAPAEVMEEAVPMPVSQFAPTAISAGGFKIILKDVKITAKRLILRPDKKKR